MARHPLCLASSPRSSRWRICSTNARYGHRAVRVDRLEVLDVDGVAADARIGVELEGDVAHHVLDELRVLVGALGDPFLVGSLERRPDLGRCRILGEAHQLAPRQLGQRLDPDRHVGALVVRAVVGDLLRARAERLDRNDDLDPDRRCTRTRLGDQAALVLEQALDARDRRALAQEKRERSLDPAGIGAEQREHPRHLATQGRDVERHVDGVEPGDEARHVSALLLGRQGDVERPLGDRRHDRAFDPQLQRVAHGANADALDRELAIVARALRVGDVENVDQVGHRWLGDGRPTGRRRCAAAPATRRSGAGSTARSRRRRARTAPAAWPDRRARRKRRAGRA